MTVPDREEVDHARILEQMAFAQAQFGHARVERIYRERVAEIAEIIHEMRLRSSSDDIASAVLAALSKAAA